MNYHDTISTQPGDYKACSHYDSILSLSQSGKWWDHADERLQGREVEKQLPLLGPLPATQEEALSLACEVAFARMVVAWCKLDPLNISRPIGQRYIDGERSISLLRDMERVTG